MGFDFKNIPNPGDVSNGYTWDGEKWSMKAAATQMYVADTAPSGAPVGSLWWESDSGLLFFNYFDGDTTQWVAVTNAAGIAAVRYDIAQTLTSETPPYGAMTQRTQARQNIYAAPLDALAYSGMQINGSMDVSQELGTTGTSTNGKYICDGWKLGVAGPAATGYQYAGALIPGTAYFLGITTGAAYSTMNAGDILHVQHAMEGYRVQRLAWGTPNAQPITVAFWSQHDVAGLYSISVRNQAISRSYVATYTQAAGGVLQYNVITIPGDTAAATWAMGNGIGIYFNMTFASGSTLTASAANTWLNGSVVAAPGQVNLASVASSWARISTVIILPGLEAPSAARSPLIMRPYDQELLTCKRYWQKSYPYGTLPGTVPSVPNAANVRQVVTAGTYCHITFPLAVEMRADPTMQSWDAVGAVTKVSFYNVGGYTNGQTLINTTNAKIFKMEGSVSANTWAVAFDYTLDARL